MKVVHYLDPKLLRNKGLARYLCNQAVYPTFEKSTTDIRKVTCKNCNKILIGIRKQ